MNPIHPDDLRLPPVSHHPETNGKKKSRKESEGPSKTGGGKISQEFIQSTASSFKKPFKKHSSKTSLRKTAILNSFSQNKIETLVDEVKQKLKEKQQAVEKETSTESDYDDAKTSASKSSGSEGYLTPRSDSDEAPSEDVSLDEGRSIDKLTSKIKQIKITHMATTSEESESEDLDDFEDDFQDRDALYEKEKLQMRNRHSTSQPSSEEEGVKAVFADSSDDETEMTHLETKKPKQKIEGKFQPLDPDSGIKKGKTVKFHATRLVGSGFSGDVAIGEAARSKIKDVKATISVKIPATRKTFAVKTLKKEQTSELEVIAKLHGVPGVNTIYGVLQGEEATHIILKYANSGDMKDFFNSHLEDKKECLNKLIEMIEMTQKLNEAGVAHRDIHEGNFVCHKKKGSDKISLSFIDFEHAKIAGEKDAIGRKPLMLMNCPPSIMNSYPAKDYQQASALNAEQFEKYQQLVDENAMKIDAFMLGTMLLRVMVAESPHKQVLTNPDHKGLISFLNQLDSRYQEKPEEREHFRLEVVKYLENKYSSLPDQINLVIAGLLDLENQMPLANALRILKKVKL